MKYTNAKSILPEELLTLIQDYIDGEYLYIPRKQENQKSWGEKVELKKAYSNEIGTFTNIISRESRFLNWPTSTFYQKKYSAHYCPTKKRPIVDTESKMS